MGDRSDEILAVLREIRDLQKQHFERYVEFTKRVMEQQRRTEEQNEESLERQRRMGRIADRQQAIGPILLGVFLFCLLVLGFLMMLK